MTQEDRDKFVLMDADIKEIKLNQEMMSHKIERLFEKASQPFLSTREVGALLVSIITYTVVVSFFISDINAMASNNKEKIEKDLKVNEVILEKVNAIAIDVAVVKNEQKRINKD